MSDIPNQPALHADLLRGADAIAEFMFGDPKLRRRVYHMISEGQIPSFSLGKIVCSRRSAITAAIEAKERQALERGAAQDA